MDEFRSLFHKPDSNESETTVGLVFGSKSLTWILIVGSYLISWYYFGWIPALGIMLSVVLALRVYGRSKLGIRHSSAKSKGSS
jgi:hypothetical protein